MKELYSKTNQTVNRENYRQLQRKNEILQNGKGIKTRESRKTELGKRIMHSIEYLPFIKRKYYYYIPMGNDTSALLAHDIVRFYRQQDWLTLSITPQFELWKHKYTHETAEVYLLSNTPSLQDMRTFEFRSKQEQLIKVYFIDANQQQGLCAISSQIKLLVEHIPYRLNDVSGLTPEEALAIFLMSLKAFMIIQDKFGPVEPEEELIGFNSEGKTKIWLNRQPFKNNIDHFSSSPNSTPSTRIISLYSIIQKKVIGSLLPQPVRQQLWNSNVDYEIAINVVQHFAQNQGFSLRKSLIRTKISQQKLMQFNGPEANRSILNTSLEGKFIGLKATHRQKRKKVPAFLELHKTVSAEQLHHRRYHPESIPHLRQTADRPQQPQKVNFSFSTVLRSSNTTDPHIPAANFTMVSESVKIEGQKQEIQPLPISQTSNQQRKYTIIDQIQSERFSEDLFKKIQQKPEEPKCSQFKPMTPEQSLKKQLESIMQFADDTPKKTPKGTTPQLYKQQTANVQTIKVEKYNQNTPLKQQNKKQSPKPSQIHKNVKTVLDAQQDFLDVNFLEKSLQNKFKQKRKQSEHMISQFEEDMLNIAKLEEGLMKFELTQKNVKKDLNELQKQNVAVQSKREKIEQRLEEKHQLEEQVLPQLHYHTLARSLSYQEPIAIDSQPYSYHANLYNTRTFTDFSHYSMYYEPTARTNNQSFYQNYSNKWHPPTTSSDFDRSIKDQRREVRKLKEKIDLEEKYLKHVKSKERYRPVISFPFIQTEPKPKTLHEKQEEQQKKPHQSDNQKAPTGESSKITYDELRLLLKTDL